MNQSRFHIGKLMNGTYPKVTTSLQRCLLGVFFLSAVAIVHATDPPDSTGVSKMVGLRLHHGFVLIHSRELVPVRHSNPSGVELDLAWHKTSQKAWESCHCYPKLGVGASFWNFDQPDILGHSITAMFYIEPVFAAWHSVSFSVRAAFGLSYQSKPYHKMLNPLNFSYSTPIAFPLQLGGSIHFRLHKKWLLDVTAVYNHISNGGIREPNKGINWPTAAVGLGYYLDEPNLINRDKKDWRAHRKPESRVDGAIFLAFKEPNSKLYLLSPGLEVKVSRQVARINALTLGAEWIYDNGTRFEIAEAGGQENPQKAGLALGHEFLLGRFLFSQQIGVYLYKPFRRGDDLYQRYGLMFRNSARFSSGISLKVHRHVADFVDFRVAYSFVK